MHFSEKLLLTNVPCFRKWIYCKLSNVLTLNLRKLLVFISSKRGNLNSWSVTMVTTVTLWTLPACWQVLDNIPSSSLTLPWFRARPFYFPLLQSLSCWGMFISRGLLYVRIKIQVKYKNCYYSSIFLFLLIFRFCSLCFNSFRLNLSKYIQNIFW